MGRLLVGVMRWWKVIEEVIAQIIVGMQKGKKVYYYCKIDNEDVEASDYFKVLEVNRENEHIIALQPIKVNGEEIQPLSGDEVWNLIQFLYTRGIVVDQPLGWEKFNETLRDIIREPCKYCDNVECDVRNDETYRPRDYDKCNFELL